jgi:hypothetical protein
MTMDLDASGPGKFPGLEALFTEDGSPLRWSKRHGRFLATGRTSCDRFNTFTGHRARRATGPFDLTVLAPFRFVLEVFVGEELLLSRRPDEFRATVNAPEDPVLELHRSLPRRVGLLQLAAELLAVPLACESLFGPALVTGFQVERMFLDVLNDVFLLDLPLETPKGALDRFALLDLYFSHVKITPLSRVAMSVA